MPLASFQKQVKLILLVVGLLVVLLVVVLAGRGVASFLAKAGTCPAQKVTASQITANSAVIAWETQDVSQGRVEYGTNATNLTFSAPEASSGKIHNVPLTLLTPNTVYYYLVAIGNTRCDSSGQSCGDSCVPWSFTTSSLSPAKEIVATNTPIPTLALTPTTASPTAGLSTPTLSAEASPTASLSSFCQKVVLNIGTSSQEATKWANLKEYDIDKNGVINGLDVIKCQKLGK